MIYYCRRRARSQESDEFEICIKCIINDLQMWHNVLKILLQMPNDIIKYSKIILWLNNNYISCIIFLSSYLYKRIYQIFFRKLISFINSTHLGYRTCMSQVLGVLHIFWYYLYTWFFWVPSFDALSG